MTWTTDIEKQKKDVEELMKKLKKKGIGISSFIVSGCFTHENKMV